MLGELLGIPVIMESITRLLEPHLQVRARLRTLDAERIADLRRFDLNERRRQAESSARVAEMIRTGATQRYPLGEPGRLRQHIRSDISPVVLVSPCISVHIDGPAEAIATSVASTIRRADSGGSFLRPATGGFVARGEGGTRYIDGSIVASEIATYEFNPNPSFIVYFVDEHDGLTAHLLASNLVKTVDGRLEFDMPLARCSGGRIAAALDGSDEVWVVDGRTAAGGATSAAQFGEVIAAYILGFAWVYWQANGVNWHVPAGVGNPLAAFEASQVASPATVERNLDERLMNEITALQAIGVEVTIEPLESGSTGLLVESEGSPSLLFVVGEGFPQHEPEVFLVDGETAEEVLLPKEQWSPACSLVEIAEAFR